MIQVGVRQLRNSLTRYLKLAEKGQAVLVMNRRHPVAMIKKPDPASAQSEEEIVAALVAEGKLLPPKRPGPVEPFRPIRVKGKPVSQMIIEDRR